MQGFRKGSTVSEALIDKKKSSLFSLWKRFSQVRRHTGKNLPGRCFPIQSRLNFLKSIFSASLACLRSYYVKSFVLKWAPNKKAAVQLGSNVGVALFQPPAKNAISGGENLSFVKGFHNFGISSFWSVLITDVRTWNIFVCLTVSNTHFSLSIVNTFLRIRCGYHQRKISLIKGTCISGTEKNTSRSKVLFSHI